MTYSIAVVQVSFEMEEFTFSEDSASMDVCILVLGATERTFNLTVNVQISGSASKCVCWVRHIISGK